MRFRWDTVVGIAILSSVLVLTVIFSGSNPQVLAGVFAMVGLWIWATRFPSKPIAFRLLHLLLYRLVFAVAAELLDSVVISAVLALIDGNLPTTLASTYLGAGDRLLRCRNYRMRHYSKNGIGRKPGKRCPVTHT